MTPGQIMEAEISATLLDNPSSPFQSASLTTVLSDESEQVCASLPENVFSISSPGPSCPGLDSDFDQVISTSTQAHQSLQPMSSSQSHTTPGHGNLPVESNPSQPHLQLENSLQSKTGRRKSDHPETSLPDSKKIRLHNGDEDVHSSSQAVDHEGLANVTSTSS